jgi:hypothetical protein
MIEKKREGRGEERRKGRRKKDKHLQKMIGCVI